MKVRFKTWYWGNYCTMKKSQPIPWGFELYNEDLHGWKNSEEYKNGKLEPYQETDHGYIDQFLNSTYYNELKKMA